MGYRRVASSGALAAALLISLGVSGVTTGAGPDSGVSAASPMQDGPIGDVPSPPEPLAPESSASNPEEEKPLPTGVSPSVAELVRALSTGRDLPSNAPLEGDALVVEIHHDLPPSRVEAVVRELGGTPAGTVEHMTVASVPAGAVGRLEATEGVRFVELPPGDPAFNSIDGLDPASIPELLGSTRANDWHRAGSTGRGVKVGIIDSFSQDLWLQAQTAGRLPAPSGGITCNLTACSAQLPWITSRSGDHGVNVAEIIHALAPDADIYLASGAFRGPRMRSVIDYFHSKGVTIISRSLGAWVYGSPGDGSGVAAGDVAYAASKGILFVNSAGNEGGNDAAGRLGAHLRISWSGNNDGTYLTDPTYGTYHPVYCSSQLGLSIRWDDWGQSAAAVTDYDLYVYDSPSGNLLAKSERYQSEGHDPIEGIGQTAPFLCAEPGWLYFRVRLYDAGGGTGSDQIQIMAQKGFLTRWSNPYTAAVEYVDSPSNAFIGAGAMEPIDGTTLAHYSSQGPTIDGRVKPDLSASVCIRTLTADQTSCTGGSPGGARGFTGTSAAAPVISGLAALVFDRQPEFGAADVRSFLIDNAVDRGEPGPDSAFGAGQVRLPEPRDVVAPRWPAPSLDVSVDGDSIALTWSTATDDTGVTGYRIFLGPARVVEGAYRGSLVGEVASSQRSFRIDEVERGARYAIWVEAVDGAGNQSTDGPLSLASLPLAFGDTGSSVFTSEIDWLSATGITRGCNPPENTRFCPDDEVTRGQMASFLVRALGLEGDPTFQFFDDDSNSVHEEDIDTLAYFEITFGCNPPLNTRFCPDQPVLRAQMASFLSRALILTDGWNVDAFGDDDGSVHEFDINRLSQSGITSGCNPPRNSRYCPTAPITRGQMAAFLYRAQDRIDAIREQLGTSPLKTQEPIHPPRSTGQYRKAI